MSALEWVFFDQFLCKSFKEIKMRFSLVFASMLALAACGALNQDGNSGKQSVSAEEAKAFSSQLPSVAIVRVPVDANGQEMHEQAEMRTTNQTSLTNANIDAVFETSDQAVATVDELDGTSSSEAFGWRRCCRKAARQQCRKPTCASNNSYSYSYSESESYSSSGYGPGSSLGYGPGYNWNMYSPTYYYGGYNYNWNYAETLKNQGNFNQGNYNYYRYNRAFDQSYNGYGWAN
jgi:hypothetical protein